jgi:hypothetical protein
VIGDVVTYEKNLPGQPYVIDPATFAQLSNHFFKSYAGMAWPGLSQKVEQKVDKYGIVSTIHIFFEGTLTGVGGAATATSGFPWRLISEACVSANGISNLFDCDGIDLRALARVRRGKSLADESVFALPTAIGNVQTLRLHWEIPLAIDEVANLGAVLAQTDDNNLSVRITTAAAADLFSANAPTIAGTFTVGVSAYEIPESTQNGRSVLVIPDLRQMHGLVTRDDVLVATGQFVTPLTKTGGLLLRTLQRIDNAPPSFGNADWLTDAVTEHFFRFNSKEIPYDYEPAWMLRFLNEGMYSQALLPAADVPAAVTPPAYVCDDYVNVLAMRDVVNMAAVSQPELVNNITAGFALNAGAKVHTVQEAMLTG